MSDTCLKTRVRNATGVKTTFGFLPPHGRTLEAGEIYEFQGTIDGLIASPVKRRQRQAFLRALEDGALRLIQTPSPVIFDDVSDEAKVLAVTSNTLSAVDACWGHASSAGV